MSGGSIAYHLRENKSIERNLFIDLLSRVGRFKNISDYTYIGFGGPFREDFKAIHNALRVSKMISIEMDENVYKRQIFNLPARIIDSRHCKSSEFIESFDAIEGNSIAWLDYTSANTLNEQITEFRTLISKMQKFDIAKITINAHAAHLGNPEDDKDPDLKNLKQDIYRAHILSKRADNFWKEPIKVAEIQTATYPKTLLKILKNSLNGLAGKVDSIYFQPLSAYTYQDGVKMLTLTGIVLDANNDAEKKEFLEKTRLRFWDFANLDWTNPTEISVPSLSAKERMAIDALLPVQLGPGETVAQHLENALGYVPGSTANDLARGRKLLENYARYYRAYPFFSRVWL